MCLQDWRLGRFISLKVQTQTPTLAAPFVLNRNAQRVGATISAIALAPTSSNTTLVRINGTDALTITGSVPILHLSRATHGDVPSQELTIVGPAIGQQVGITEYFLSEQIQQALVEEFERIFLQ